MNVKTVLAVALVSAGLVSLGGCASMSKKGDSSAMNLNSGIDDNVDVAYVQRVNQEANRHFAVVLWVNPPQKAPDRTQHD